MLVLGSLEEPDYTFALQHPRLSTALTHNIRFSLLLAAEQKLTQAIYKRNKLVTLK